ncbi:hypothetical protein DRO60_03260 [Candidatus Bathyarchaeota archaeon]|nr:MAG: hypothetical protein DRO60_03260 [Candidatus Bathyarchaeota archaeon]
MRRQLMRRRTKVLIASNAVASMGWGLCWSYLNFRLYDIGASYQQICLMDSLAAITYLTSRLWGALSDYYGRRKPFMVSGFTASALPVILMAMLNDSVWALIWAYFGCCLAWAVAYPALMAALTSDPRREEATTIFTLVGNLGWALGSFMMGPADRYLGPSGVFTACLLILLVFPLVLLFYREEPLPRKPGSPWAYARSSISFRFKARKGFGFLLAGVFLAWFGLQWSSPLARMRFYDLLGRSKLVMGFLWGLSSIASAVALVTARKIVEKLGGLRTLAISTACYAIVMPCFALIESPVAYAVLWVIPIWSFFNLGYILSPAELTEEDVRGEAMGSCEVAKNIGVFLGIFGGFTADVLDRETSMLISAAPLSLALVPLALSWLAQKKEARALAGQVAS